ncbi:MAG: winged helix-turn-helix transcriptional regulator [Nitrososphaerales archaeon]
MADWEKVLFNLSDTKILFYLEEKESSSYSELLGRVIKSRSTLASSLTDLQEMKLIERKVKDSRPIRTEYLLTKRGKELVQLLSSVKSLLDL